MKRILLLLLISTGLSSPVWADNYFWVGGTGNWQDYATHWATSSGGNLFHMQVPGSGDTVIFDSLSFNTTSDTIYADSSIVYCYDMRWQNVQHRPMFYSLSNASNSILKVYGSLQLDTGMVWEYAGLVRFYGLNPGNTIRTCGQYFSRIDFTGDTAGTWYQQDTLRVGMITFTSGRFYSAGFPIYCGGFLFVANNLANVDLDTSYIQLNWTFAYDLPASFDADSCTIDYYGPDFFELTNQYGTVIFQTTCGVNTSASFIKAVFMKNGELPFSNTFGRLEIPNPGSALTIFSGQTITILDTLIASGSCNSMNVIFNTGMGTSYISKASGLIQLDHIILHSIDAIGGATFNATNSYTQGACNGWNLSSPVTPRVLYWVNGNGNWNDTAHWSATSGGAAGECPPNPADDVVVDAASLSSGDQISSVVSNIFFRSLNWLNTNNGIFSHASSMTQAYGSFLLNTNMQDAGGSICFRDTGTSTLVNTAGHTMSNLYFIGAGTRTVNSGLTVSNQIDCLLGSVFFNGNQIHTVIFNHYAGCQIDLSGSNISTSFFMNQGSLIGSPAVVGTSKFYDYAGENFPHVIMSFEGELQGTNTVFGTVDFLGQSFISGNNQFDTVRFNGPGYVNTISSGSTQTIMNYLGVNSSCSGMSMLRSSVQGQQAYFSKANGVVTLNDVIMEDIHAIGGASFNALLSVAISNVTGWNITPPPALPMYWIGGTGDWNDPAHWSNTSGGSPASCVPNPLTDVYFDSNSFIGNSDLVQVNIPFAYCHNMNWINPIGNPAMVNTFPLNLLKCYGSFVLDTNVIASQAAIQFCSPNSGNTVNGNNQFVGYVSFEHMTGDWTLVGDLRAGALMVNSGTFKTAGFSLVADSLVANDSIFKQIELDSSLVTVGKWKLNDTGLCSLQAIQSTLIVNGPDFNGGDGQRYGEIDFAGDVTLRNNDTIGFARFTGMASIEGNTTFDSLFFDNPGNQVTITSGSTQTVHEKLITSATSSLPIGIESSLGFAAASLVKINDTVCVDFLTLRGIAATGGATFYAGAYSSDAGNNSGWVWQSCNPVLVDVWPGDANRDLIADNLDILAIGVAFGKTGTQRANASSTWVAQPAYTWNEAFANTSDIVNADGDGNGVIGFSDTVAVSLNYGLTHPARLGNPDSIQMVGPDLWLNCPTFSVNNGDTASIGVMLGTSALQASDVYGIAFQINYNAASIVPGSVWIEFNGSWMCPTGNVVYLVKHFAGQQQMEIALSRIDHQNASGDGEIARIHFQTTPGYIGVFKAWFTDVHLIDAYEIEKPTSLLYGTFAIVGMDDLTTPSLRAYPNPTSGDYIISDEQLIGEPVEIIVTDMAGRMLIQEQSNGEEKYTLHLGDFSPGVYIVTVNAKNRQYVNRVIRQ
jgi:Secretion system C-terminal sorting domain